MLRNPFLLAVLLGASLPTAALASFQGVAAYHAALHTNSAQAFAFPTDSQGKAIGQSPFVHSSGQPYDVGPSVAATTLPAGPFAFPETPGEAEEEIAVDPNNSSNLLAAISDYTISGNTTKYAWSNDNGATWTQSFVPFVGPFVFSTDIGPATTALMTTGDGLQWLANSDPVVAEDRQGNVYLSNLYFNVRFHAPFLFVTSSNGVYVSVAKRDPNTGSVTFTTANTRPIAENADPDPFGPSELEDKDWLAVDNSDSDSSGNAYLSWTHFTSPSLASGMQTTTIDFSRSTDHGQSWSAPIAISPTIFDNIPTATTPFPLVQGSQVAVGPHGEVYVVWGYFISIPTGFFNGGPAQLFLSKSTDGGQTFTAPVAITPAFTPLPQNVSWRRDPFPALAVSPRNGHVFVAYADQSGSGSHVEFIRSVDGGESFSDPQRLDDGPDAGNRSMPAITVDEHGVVHCSWFDSRNSTDPGNYDIYASESWDNGSSFTPNARVTAQTVLASGSRFIGDYAGIAAGGGFAHPVWPGTGIKLGQLFTATLTGKK